ncbi:helix-turn-helix transcriptional regulator [Adlercreutzia equolifaciens]|uniref:helix-turn-helix transcriptional regulator n=1 Tax=Adlercreutzia equolifaciens TaxID=446660 RepID=UPI00399C6425
MLWFAPSVGSDAALIWGALGAGCYALGLVALGARMFLMLGVLARREGLKAVLALVVLAALCGHVAFAYSAPAPFYAFIAVAGLSLSGIAQLCFGLLAVPASAAADGGEVPSPCDADLYGNGWRFFYVIFFATVLVHGLLYVADPALEYLGDAPLSRGVTFLLLFSLSVLMLATSSKASRYLRAVCLFGNGLFAVLFLGLVAVSFSSLTHGDFSAAAGVVLALIRVFDVLLLVAMFVSAFLKGSNLVRTAAVYLLALFWLPTTFAYVLLPLATAGHALDAGTLLGPASLVIAAVLALAIVAFLTLFMVKAARPLSAARPAAEKEGRREACDALAEQHDLTRREGEILYYISLGYSSKAIAEKLFVAPGTVQSHTKRIYAKLGVHAKQELIELVNREEGDG